jgi:hypothetical protein
MHRDITAQRMETNQATDRTEKKLETSEVGSSDLRPGAIAIAVYSMTGETVGVA